MAMGTAPRTPLVSQRRQGFAIVSAAAPWFIPLLAVAALSSSSMAAAAAGSPEVVELTLLANAREKGAGIRLTISLHSFRWFVVGSIRGWFLIAYVFTLQFAWTVAHLVTTSREASAPENTAGSSILR